MRWIGFDTGSAHCGWAVLDIESGRTSHVDSGVIEVGYLGAGRGAKKQERLISAETLDQFTEHAQRLLRGPLVEAVAIEWHPRIANIPRFSADLGQQLKTAELLAGVIYGLCAASGRHVHLVTPEEWRLALCGGRQATDAQVKAVVSAVVAGWPKQSNNHERDAAGVAVFAERRAALGPGIAPKPDVPMCLCPAASEYDPPCPAHGIKGIGVTGR